jgi:hypothetical protein
MAESKGLPVDRAAEILHRSPETIHRWIHDGKLPPGITAHKGTIDGHEQWLVDMPDAPSTDRSDTPSWSVILAEKDREIALLRSQLTEKDKQISELHVIIARSQPKQLEEPGRRRWWSSLIFWKR